MQTILVGIYGATGYTGLELIQLLVNHPHVKIDFATSESMAGGNLKKSRPLAPGLRLVSAADAPLNEVDCVFLCLPHTRSAPVAGVAIKEGVRVIDLSADLRFDSPDGYSHWYKVPHPAPDLLPVPYGLPELGRDKIKGVDCIANPGCYATAVLLGMAPLVRRGLISEGTPVIVDAKSGVSGAGRSPKQHILFGEVHGNFSPYSIGRTHRHLGEIEQELVKSGFESGRLVFSPHLLPTDRGILAAIYAQVTDMEAAQGAYPEAYGGEPLIEVLPGGQLATLAHVVRTPRAVISLTAATESTLIVNVAIDNLLKGAASQAVQNFNLMWNLSETMGL